MAIIDKYGRTFETLRVSLTNTCNFGCVYCVHSSTNPPNKINSKILSYNELIQLIASIHKLTPLKNIRITGGEPTLYKDLIPFIKALKQLEIGEIKMTTNGYLLNDKLPALAKAGLTNINISLDALNNVHFKKIANRNHLEYILEAIGTALSFNIKLKLNTVVLKNINDDQIIPLLEFAQSRNIPIRFLELMKMGPMHQSSKFNEYFISEEEILERIALHYQFKPMDRKKSATANYWKTTTGLKFGIIANESTPFCYDCNRLRLDSYGKIYGCLSNENGINISNSNQEILATNLIEALAAKQELKFKGSSLSMMAIGG